MSQFKFKMTHYLSSNCEFTKKYPIAKKHLQNLRLRYMVSVYDVYYNWSILSLSVYINIDMSML